MFFEYLETEGYTQVNAEVTDRCVLCELFDSCPLINALELNLVYPFADNLTIEECSLYTPESFED